MNKILIIPDVHGRTFWKEEVYRVIENEEDTHIVFLGDYVDPYQYEGIFPEDGIVTLEEIIDLKKRCPNQITLLLGNHDCGYIWRDVCSSRRSVKYYSDISALFNKNIQLFDLAYSAAFSEMKYLFSHAGVHKFWLDLVYGPHDTYENIDMFLNNSLHVGQENLDSSLGIYSYYRGWGGGNFGSCIWADVREWSKKDGNIQENQKLEYYQIFGHTQLENEPIVEKSFACLDVRRYFYLTKENKLLDPQHPTGEYEYKL